MARDKIVAALDRLERELDGNEYLVGDTFTVADLTAAALFNPIVLPDGGRSRRRAAAAARDGGIPRAASKDRDGSQWVEEMYAPATARPAKAAARA